jgi:hypothetical protein
VCALAKGIRTPPTMATRLTAEPTSMKPPVGDARKRRYPPPDESCRFGSVRFGDRLAACKGL